MSSQPASENALGSAALVVHRTAKRLLVCAQLRTKHGDQVCLPNEAAWKITQELLKGKRLIG